MFKIRNDKFKLWLEDRCSINITSEAILLKERHNPVLLPDIPIFDQSLLKHRLELPRKVDFELLLIAYEEAMKAAGDLRDPIVNLASILQLTDKKTRLMFSAYRAHPLDEMKHIAEVMVHVVRVNFPDVPIGDDDVIYLDGKPAIGVGEFVYSGFGGSLPVRDRSDTMRRNVSPFTQPISDSWIPLYKRHRFDEEALRVLDVLRTTDSSNANLKAITLNTSIKIPLNKPGKRILNKDRRPPSLETLAYLEQMLRDSQRPVVDMYRMLVPVSLSSEDFQRDIGNPKTQSGLVRAATMTKIVTWIEMQKHLAEQACIC